MIVGQFVPILSLVPTVFILEVWLHTYLLIININNFLIVVFIYILSS